VSRVVVAELNVQLAVCTSIISGSALCNCKISQCNWPIYGND